MTSTNGNEIDWQGAIGTNNGRMKYLLETGLESDVEFLVGTGKELADGKEEKQLFKAHKLFLMTSSCIFAAQFRFNKTSGRNEDAPIEVTDIKADAFNAVLRFIYFDDIASINVENYVGVYTAAKKYLLHVLAQKCVELADEMVDHDNIFEVLRMAKLHEETTLLEHCWSLIDGCIGFYDENFSKLSRDEMTEIFGRDTLQYDEGFLFFHLEKWAIKQCKNAGIFEPIGEQKRAEMGDLLFAIRFPLIPPMEFIEEIVPLGILNNAEVSSMLLHYAEIEPEEGHAPLPFSVKHRAIPPPNSEYNKLMDKGLAKIEKLELTNKNLLLQLQMIRLENKLLEDEFESAKMYLQIQTEKAQVEEKLLEANKRLRAYGHPEVE